ncbi:ligand-dependent nuclear receptor-interacting factor 1 [Phyllobates terribilis]|uniref:ligand-dependent nuclear receptor-interacting factor 1 n=1 Tax=Phyllobates terribilis TaxID=111132 RepID=UPI003CCB654A
MSQPLRPPQLPGQSLTGCFYQIVQATGPQGTNVLNLLPILKPKDKPIPAAPPAPSPSAPPAHSASVPNIPQAVISSAPPSIPVLSRPSPVSVPLIQTPTLGNYIISTQGNTLHVENQFPVFQEATLFLDRGHLTLPANSVPGNPPRFIMVNTKPASPVKPMPALPTGHSLQIPSHAEVMSVPVSSLPFSIQQKILPQASVGDISKVPSVIYVSPVNTVKSGAAQSSQYNPSPGTKLPSQPRPPSGRSEALNGPMKWVVQENQESAACLVPVKSSNDTASKILQMLTKTKMEDVNVTNPDQSKVVQIKDNALVMCNNKIFFLTKKGTEIINTGTKIQEPPQFATSEKPTAKMKPMNELSNKVVQVVLAKNKSPSPTSELSVQSNVVSIAKPKRKSTTPRAVRGDLSVLYMPEDSGSNVYREVWAAPSCAVSSSPSAASSQSCAVSSSASALPSAAAAPPNAASTPSCAVSSSPSAASAPSCAVSSSASAAGAQFNAASAPSCAVSSSPSAASAPPCAVSSSPSALATAARAPATAARAPASAAHAPPSAARSPPCAVSSLARAPASAARAPASAARTPASAAHAPASAAGAPPSAANTSVVNAANKGDSARNTDQPLPESQKTEIVTFPKPPETKGMDERSWRLKFGLLKKEKIILKRIPLIQAVVGTSASNGSPLGGSESLVTDPIETEPKQLKRKSSQTGKVTKVQKSWESGDVNQNSPDPEVSDDPSSPVPGGATTHESHSTWPHQDAYDPADFQLSPDSAEHFSDVLLPSSRFHIDYMYPDETTKDEKIQRLKEVLKERENAVEALRRQKI